MKPLLTTLLILLAIPGLLWADLSGWSIGIDPGHGGTDPGAVGPTGLQEKEVNLDASLAARAFLVRENAEVYLTRTTDVTLSLSSRANFMNSLDVDRCLCVHHNASASPDPNWHLTYVAEGYAWATAGNLADDVAHRVTAFNGLPFGWSNCGREGVYEENFYLLIYTTMPAVLPEISFISNPEEEQRLYRDRYCCGHGRALCHALGDHLGGWEQSLPDPSQPTYSQSITLHEGWNLVSWHIVPVGTPGEDILFQDILPSSATWFQATGEEATIGELYTYMDPLSWYPDYGILGTDEWILDNAYYIHMEQTHNWNDFANRPAMSLGPVTGIVPSDAWDNHPNQPTSYRFANKWFFMGYAAPGYCKLASVVNDSYLPQAPSGDPTYFDYEGPFHWLIWEDDALNNYPLYELKIVKDDRGAAYIPDPDPINHSEPLIDQIGVLEPGRGYFLGFQTSGSYTFEGWASWPQWHNENIDPDPKSNQNLIASSNHFQYNKYTHWSFPVVIDTIDQTQCPMSTGDEIGIFDGDMCVGATVYQGEFPLVVTTWEDDKATPLELDGYTDGNNMIFKWYDASENTELEFQLPPMIASKEDDDRVAPQYAGFGQGFYARRTFMNGIAAVHQLPREFSIGPNYPNPFNPSTIIPLELPQRSRVRIDIFDVTGRKVWTIDAGVKSAGWPKIHFHATNLSSGVYFYRVTAEGLERGGTYTDVGKMLLLK